MTVITVTAIILSLFFILALLFFQHDLRWDCAEDRKAIYGFCVMIGVLVLDIADLVLSMR